MEKTLDKRYCRVPEKVGETVRSIMAKTDVRKMEHEWKIFSVWSDIVGEAIAEAATPVDIKDGILHLRVDNAAWRTELHYMKRDMIEKINSFTKSKLINNILLR
jgi:hypothetical protein